ncbi:hypothetical protein ABDK56_00610 [Sphingomonas sp. ASV193]|uniref:hypothetical protein n=1 Tax=Sphingomonas sp. ASV193 TaxID=3144405 RepID=UPI0032E911CA
MKHCLFGAGLALVATAANAQVAPKLLNDPTSLDWTYYGGGYRLKPIREIAIPGGAAVEVTVEKGSQPYAAGATVPLTGPFVKGRDYVVAFWARTIASKAADRQGRILVRFFRNQDPYPGFGDSLLSIGSEWHRYEVSARATMDIDQAAAIGLQLASATQTLQIGQMHVAEGVTTLSTNALKPVVNDPLPPQIADKGELLNDPDDRNWVAYGDAQTVLATSTDVFTRKATLQTVAVAGANPYDAGLNAPIKGAIRAGDRLLVAVLARAKSAETADGTGLVTLRLQKNQAPYPGWGEQPIHPAPGWKLFQWQTTAQFDLPAGEGEVALHSGTAKQAIEFGPVYVIRLK